MLISGNGSAFNISETSLHFDGLTTASFGFCSISDIIIGV
jgi:hypothetical protein